MLTPQKDNVTTTQKITQKQNTNSSNMLDCDLKDKKATEIQKVTKNIKVTQKLVKKTVKVERVSRNLEGLDRMQEEMKLSFHNLIKKILDKIYEMFSNFFKKFLPKFITKYLNNQKAKKERAELLKKIQKRQLDLKPKLK